MALDANVNDPTATTPFVSDPEKQKFVDEPVDVSSPEDAAFASDNGEGTASLMKPSKPTRHHRAHDSNYSIDGNRMKKEDALEEESCDTNSTVIQFAEAKWSIVSASIFVASSILYLAMACMIMDSLWFYKDVPQFVYTADDDATWWNYFVNCTDDGYIPENITMADDDYTWVEWYNNSFFEDDIVWLPKIANANAPGIEPYVSKYMLLYFCAAFGFLITGVIEIVLARKSPMSVRLLYYLMMLAAIFGLVSAILTNKDPFWSAVCNCWSTNLWALEAIFIVAQRINGSGDIAEYDDGQKICNWSILKWLWIADISFLIGTFGDAISSWLYIFGYDNYMLGIGAIIFASMWQICAIVYLALAIYDYRKFKVYFDLANEYEKEIKDMAKGGIVNVADLKEVSGDDDDDAGDNEKEGLSKKDFTQNTTAGSSPPSSNNSSSEAPDVAAKSTAVHAS